MNGQSLTKFLIFSFGSSRKGKKKSGCSSSREINANLFGRFCPYVLDYMGDDNDGGRSSGGHVLVRYHCCWIHSMIIILDAVKGAKAKPASER